MEAADLSSTTARAAKLAARLAKAKSAHDEVIAAVYRAQADALEIESLAKRRLADEYDAAQERGEVSVRGQHGSHVPEENMRATVADIGLSRKDIYEARQIRDAEKADPGVVRRTLNGLLEAGEQPTKAAINRELVNRTSFTGNNEWYTPGEYLEAARDVLGTFTDNHGGPVRTGARFCFLTIIRKQKAAPCARARTLVDLVGQLTYRRPRGRADAR